MERGGEGYFTQANKDSSRIGPSHLIRVPPMDDRAKFCLHTQ